MKNRTIFLMIAHLFLGTFYACQPTPTPEQEVKSPAIEELDQVVRVSKTQFDASDFALGKVETKSFNSIITTSGMLNLPAKSKVIVSNFMGGEIANFRLLQGEWVKKGQRLFTLSNPELITLQQELLEVRGELIFLQSEYERQKTLSDENISAKKNYLKAQSNYQGAQIREAALSKKLTLIGINPIDLKPEKITSSVSVFAPTSGIVSMLNLVNGQSLKPTEPALEISKINDLFLELNVLEKDAHYLEKGQKIKFKLQNDPSKTYSAYIHLIEKVIKENRMVTIYCNIEKEKHGQLLPGMFASAEIELDQVSSPALPEQAIVLRDGQSYALQLKKSTTPFEFEIVPLKSGMTKNGYTQLIDLEETAANADYLVKGSYYLLSADE